MNSRRERMVYIVGAITIAFAIFCILMKVSLYEATAYITPYLVLAGYYVAQETIRKSEPIKEQ